MIGVIRSLTISGQHDWNLLKKNPCFAKCSACKKIFSLSNMGRQAIISHEKGPKHQKNIKFKNSSGMQLFLANFINKSQPTASVPVSKESVSSTSASVLMETESAESITSTLEFLDEGSLKELLVVVEKQSTSTSLMTK
ncbi:hypothetical protein AVEN_82825-1 [Araneus ventricosus]|uniref:Uncharacterized protein n=1 Tax=Araneus ventricosus TaxID=182803 RepID=A0A4Y2F6A2_ARAVE|nr:hypothetical protein AVEN_82825-1 [Araneus ventricosus]